MEKLAYRFKNGVYQHNSRKVIFVGDFIDRGPKIRETLQLVKTMVEKGSALAVMGNHEYNAICYHTKDKNGNYLREHTPGNTYEHKRTLEEFTRSPGEFDEYIQWFKSLPLYLELDGLRVIHAYWSINHIRNLKRMAKLYSNQEDFINRSAIKSNIEYNIVDELLKGKEIELPNDISFVDKNGIIRNKARVRWWLQPDHLTFKNYALGGEFPDTPLPQNFTESLEYYNPADVPVFFGHYWFEGPVKLATTNSCCLDFSVAGGGKLAAYRWDGEKQLDNNKLVYVSTN